MGPAARRTEGRLREDTWNGTSYKSGSGRVGDATYVQRRQMYSEAHYTRRAPNTWGCHSKPILRILPHPTSLNMACNLRPVLHLCLHFNPCLCKTSSALSDASSSLLFTPQKSRRQVTTWVHQINAQSISHCGVLWGTIVRIFCLWGRIIPKQDFQRSVVWHPRGLRAYYEVNMMVRIVNVCSIDSFGAGELSIRQYVRPMYALGLGDCGLKAT